MGESSSSTQWTQEYSTSDSIDDDLQFPSSFSSPLAEWDNNEFSENPQEIPWNQLLMSESTVMHGDMVVDSRYSCYPLIGSAATEDRGQYQTMEEFPSPSIQWPDDSTTIDPVRILPPDDFLNFDYPFLADTAADHTTNHRTGLLSDVVNFDLQPMRRDAAVSLPAPPVDLPQREAGTTTNGGAKSLEAKTRKRWTLEEHWRFLMGLKEYGSGDWKKISKNFVTSRSSTQVASHAQKFFLRQQHCSPREKRKRKSIHDYSTEDLDFLTQLLANRNQPEDHQPSTSNFPIIQPSFPQPPPPFHQTEYHQPSRNYASMIQHPSTSSQSIPTRQLPSTNYLTSMMINYSPSELTYQTQYHQSSRNYASTIQHPSTSPRLLPSQQWPSTNYSTPINYLPLELAYQTQYGQPSLKYASTIQHPSTSSGSVLSQQLTSRNYSMPSQQLASSNYLVPSQQSASMSSTVLSQQLTSTNYSVPSQQLMTSTNYSIPSQQLASMSSSSPSQQLTSTNYSVPSQQLASMSSSIPSQQLAFTNYTPHGFSSMI